jgi:hypothetical protein
MLAPLPVQTLPGEETLCLSVGCLWQLLKHKPGLLRRA